MRMAIASGMRKSLPAVNSHGITLERLAISMTQPTSALMYVGVKPWSAAHDRFDVHGISDLEGQTLTLKERPAQCGPYNINVVSSRL